MANNLKLHFVGADHEVTGSCHVIELDDKFYMVDRGMEQGKDLYENSDIPCKASEIEAIFLTHAHIDHSGLIPLMVAQGFSGRIYATRATCDLCDTMLRDSAHIQEFEAEWRNRKGQRLGNKPFVPLYTMADAMNSLNLFVPAEYNEIVEVAENLKIRFTDVGHLLGSACIEVWAGSGENERKLLFSGDLGNHDQPILKDPQTVDSADYLIIESTYGDRSHEMQVNYIDALVPIIQRTLDRGGNVVIPSFAVGRTQEMLYFIRHIKENNLISGHDGFPVVVDSPLATEATTIFGKHTMDCYDDEARALIDRGINPIAFHGLTLSVTSDDSKAINEDTTPKVILSASGMCEAGRIKHHLKHNLWRPESTVLFVGYQAEGTLGRQLIDGAKEVKLFGETVIAEAEICNLPGISGHADREGLLNWAKAINPAPKKTFVVHGEDSVCDGFAELLNTELGFVSTAPYSGAIYDLLEDKYEVEPAGKAIVKTEKTKTNPIESVTYARLSDDNSVFARLLRAGDRLMGVIRKMESKSKKEIGAMLDAVTELTDQWDDEYIPDTKKDKKKK